MCKTDERFARIKEYYRERDHAELRQGRLPMRSTDAGFWGTSNLDDVYAWLTAMAFPAGTRFIDLGMGDGRVVLVANLFLHATGVEDDTALVQTARDAAAALDNTATLRHGRIEDEDFTAYDILYMYADQNFSFLAKKLREELHGTLWLYHDTYHPEGLVKGRIFWAGQIPLFPYTAPTRGE